LSPASFNYPEAAARTSLYGFERPSLPVILSCHLLPAQHAPSRRRNSRGKEAVVLWLVPRALFAL
jgi:hypothetical protein